MATINLLSDYYESVSRSNANQTLLNMYLEMSQAKGRYETIAVTCPGLLLFSTISGTEVRGIVNHQNILYAVVDGTFYSVSSDGTATSKGTLSTDSGNVKFAQIRDEIVFVDGSSGYHYDSSTDTLTNLTVSSLDFPANPTTIASQDGYFIVSAGGTQQFYVSALDDGTSWSALSFASSEGQNDNLMAVISDKRELYLIGEQTAEVWYNAAQVVQPFAKRSAVFIEYGTVAKDSVASGDNTTYWLSRSKEGQGYIVAMAGYQPKVISNNAIEHQINNMTTLDDAIGFLYQDSGHLFYVLTFPTENKTFVYDASNNTWHARSSYIGNENSRYRANNHCFCYGKHIVGDFASGNLYVLDRDTATDAGDVLIRKVRSPVVYQTDDTISIYQLIVDIDKAPGKESGQGSDPQMILRTSKDGGLTFSYELRTAMGKIGETRKRVIFNRLGGAREMVFEIIVTDPVCFKLLGAHASLGVGDT